MKQILVATDFSSRSDRAVRRATLLAKTFDASLTLVHVVDDDQSARIVRAEQEAALSLLDQQARSLRDLDGVRCAPHVLLGDPFEALVKAADQYAADLVVIGPHRRQALKDVFVGTTAERTIRMCSRPVLMANGVPAGPYRRLLLAVDLSECSGEAIRKLGELGLEAHAAVTVVHLFDAPGAGLVARSPISDDQLKDYIADEEERAAVELAKFLSGTGLKAARKILKLGQGSRAHAICAVAREIGADLIVVGTHGRSKASLARVLLGSVAEEVLRVAECDVLAVPPKRSE